MDSKNFPNKLTMPNTKKNAEKYFVAFHLFLIYKLKMLACNFQKLKFKTKRENLK